MLKFAAISLVAMTLALVPANGAAAQGKCRFCDANPAPVGVGEGRPNTGPSPAPAPTPAPIPDPAPAPTAGSGNSGAGNNGNGSGGSGTNTGNGNGNNGNGNGNGGSGGSGDTGNGNGNNGNGNGNGGSNQIALSIESELNFGRLVMIGDGVGQVLLDIQTGAKTVVGNLNDLGGMPVQGRAIITGTPLRAVTVDFPSSIIMRDPAGGEAELRDFVTDLSALPMLSSAGTLEFHFTGTLYTGNTIALGGNLRGRVPIQVDYN